MIFNHSKMLKGADFVVFISSLKTFGPLAFMKYHEQHQSCLKQGLSIICMTLMLFTVLSGDYLYGQSNNQRVISIHNIHTKETLTVTYKKNGKYIPSAMKKVNHIMRDWRRNESRVMRKDLIDLMWEVHSQTGSKKPIYLISGYRSLKTNNKLRKTRGGQARRSRHILGMAADVHFPDIPVRELRETALIRERGGVGYYPTSGLPFVHMDVGRVRHWPRATRSQLARLFPKGRSKHIPSDGRPLTKADARKYGAAKHMASMRKIQIARALSRDRAKGTAIAALAPPKQKPIAQKKQPPLDRSALEKRLASLEPLPDNKAIKRAAIMPETKMSETKAPIKKPTKAAPKSPPKSPWWRGQTIAGLEPQHTKLEEEHALVQLASIDTSMPIKWQSFTGPKKTNVIEQNNIVYSPKFDAEHPEELNYRPFSLSPLMTDQPVAENQNLAKLSPPDYAQTSVILSDSHTINSAKFRPGLQHANIEWATQLVGSALPENGPPLPKRRGRQKRP